jgi:hypothetical protein
MLDPHENKLLGNNNSNVLNDIGSHWKTRSQLSAQIMDEQEYRSAHTQGTDEPELSEDPQ